MRQAHLFNARAESKFAKHIIMKLEHVAGAKIFGTARVKHLETIVGWFGTAHVFKTHLKLFKHMSQTCTCIQNVSKTRFPDVS